MSVRRWLAIGAVAALPLAGAVTAATSGAAQASTETCNSCIHVQSEYAFRGALDAVGQATAVNSPLSLWYEQASTTDPGADFLVSGEGTVIPSTVITNDGVVNQSGLNWYDYEGDSYVRFKYDPYGNGGADTYLGLNGTKIALRANNPDSIWQEVIEAPVTAAGTPDGSGPLDLGGVPNACGSPTTTSALATRHCVLIDVGQTANTVNPLVITDPDDAFTGSLVQQDLELPIINQNTEFATNQVWDFRA